MVTFKTAEMISGAAYASTSLLSFTLLIQTNAERTVNFLNTKEKNTCESYPRIIKGLSETTSVS